MIEAEQQTAIYCQRCNRLIGYSTADSFILESVVCKFTVTVHCITCGQKRVWVSPADKNKQKKKSALYFPNEKH